MTFELKEPVLVIGLGGAGIRLASDMREVLGADSLNISQDKKDVSEHNSIHISTKSIINPSVQLIRGCAMDNFSRASFDNVCILLYSILIGSLTLFCFFIFSICSVCLFR